MSRNLTIHKDKPMAKKNNANTDRKALQQRVVDLMKQEADAMNQWREEARSVVFRVPPAYVTQIRQAISDAYKALFESYPEWVSAKKNRDDVGREAEKIKDKIGNITHKSLESYPELVSAYRDFHDLALEMTKVQDRIVADAVGACEESEEL